MNEREKIISFLLAACDQKDKIIASLQAQLAEVKGETPSGKASVQPEGSVHAAEGIQGSG